MSTFIKITGEINLNYALSQKIGKLMWGRNEEEMLVSLVICFTTSNIQTGATTSNTMLEIAEFGELPMRDAVLLVEKMEGALRDKLTSPLNPEELITGIHEVMIVAVNQ